MMRWILRVLGALLLVALMAPPAGAVAYSVVDQAGQPVVVVKMSFWTGRAGETPHEVRPDDKGQLDVGTVPSGCYQMTIVNRTTVRGRACIEDGRIVSLTNRDLSLDPERNRIVVQVPRRPRAVDIANAGDPEATTSAGDGRNSGDQDQSEEDETSQQDEDQDEEKHQPEKREFRA
ncbi:MAG: hypothetical protein ACE5H5_06870, partial [Nitrospinota bacterium]